MPQMSHRYKSQKHIRALRLFLFRNLHARIYCSIALREHRRTSAQIKCNTLIKTNEPESLTVIHTCKCIYVYKYLYTYTTDWHQKATNYAPCNIGVRNCGCDVCAHQSICPPARQILQIFITKSFTIHDLWLNIFLWCSLRWPSWTSRVQHKMKFARGSSSQSLMISIVRRHLRSMCFLCSFTCGQYRTTIPHANAHMYIHNRAQRSTSI